MKHTVAKLSKLLGSAFLATGVVSAVMTAPVYAASTTGLCSVNDVKYNPSGIAATDCRGELELNSQAWDFNNDVLGDGNPLLGQLNNLFGVNYDWSFVSKDETVGTQGVFDGYSNTKSGIWNVTTPINGPFAISLKAGTGFAVYLFDNISQASSITNGTWSTAGLLNNGGQQPNLSHISLFKASSRSTPGSGLVPVPEPTTMLGLGVVAAGMLVARRRQTSC